MTRPGALLLAGWLLLIGGPLGFGLWTLIAVEALAGEPALQAFWLGVAGAGLSLACGLLLVFRARRPKHGLSSQRGELVT